jgi:hypothetical protein
MTLIIDNLAGSGCGSATVLPGTEASLYVTCACNVDTWPTYLTTTGVGDSITLDGNIVLLAGMFFAKIDIIVDTGEIEHNKVGPRGNKNFTNKLSFKVVKNKASDEWFDKNPNACIIGIIAQKDGQKRVFGTPGVPASIDEATGKGGMANDSEATWAAVISDTTGRVNPYYTGTIDVTV